MLSIYKVAWVVYGAGKEYPQDGYRGDLYGSDLITAGNARIAASAVRSARPEVTIRRTEIICKAENDNG